VQGFEVLKPEQIRPLLEDPRIVIRKAPPWKKNVMEMPPGTRRGLGISISLSKKCSGIRGSAIDPSTGKLVPRKALKQKELSRKLRGRYDELFPRVEEE